MKTLLSLIISGALVVSGYSQTRNVLVGTNNAVVQPTNFWSADASNARTGLGLGSAATNPVSAFQPSSLALSNIASNNGASLTNIAASNIVGTLSLGQGGTGSTNASDARIALGLGTAATNSAAAFQTASIVLSNLAASNGGSLTNITAANIVGVIPSSNLPSATFTNLSGILSITQGGTGATNAANARQNLGSTTVGDAVFVATNAEIARTSLGATTVGSSVFTALDASSARTSLGLGTASTNPSSAFQPSSTILSNLSLGSGAGLTNVTASAISFALAISNTAGLQAALDGKLATNGSAAGLTNFPTVVLQTNSSLSLFPEGLLRTNGDASGLTNFPVISVTSGGTGGTNEATARSGIGLGTTNTLTIAGVVAQNLTIASGGGITLQAALTNAASFRTNIGLSWTGLTNVDASSFRSALGLGSASTNASSAFQLFSTNLTNLAANNAINLTNIQASNIVGLINSTNIPVVNLTNISGTLSLAKGGTGASNAISARVALGLGSASTNPASAFQPSSTNLTNLSTNNGANLTNIPVAGVVGALSTNGSAAGLTNFPTSLLTTNGSASGLTNFPTVPLASNVTGTIAISNGGSGATTAGGARTNLELGATNNVVFNTLHAEQDASSGVYTLSLGQTNTGFRGTGGGASDFVFARNGTNILGLTSGNIQSFVGHSFSAPLTLNYGAGSTAVIAFAGVDSVTGAAISRTNLGLGWSALTNTNASGFQTALFGTGTNPVLVNTNGEVISPTNFWQAAPINTRVQISQPVANATNNATNARNLFLYSLAISTTGVTNTIQLPTNGGTFLGDVATVIHEGPTSSITAVRQTGAGSNLITLNQFQEAVKFIYESGGWRLADNISYVEPIYFSGTNAAANAAASRTNLGLGATNDVDFNTITLDNGVEVNGTAIAFGGTNKIDLEQNFLEGGNWVIYGSLAFNNTTNAAIARTNLGLPLAALTNTSVTNFQKAIFYTNTAPSNIGGNLGTIAAWIEIVASNGVTYKIPAYTNVP